MKIKHKKVSLLASTLITFGSLAGGANAALTLTVNVTDSTFAFSGSATGTPQFFFSDGRIAWSISNVDPGTSVANGSFFYQNDVAFSTDTGTPGGLFHDTQFTANATGNGTVIIELEVSETGSQTLTGNNAFQSYNGLGASKSLLESLNGATMSATGGHGMGDLTVQVITTPEPSSALLLGLGGLGFLVRRKRAH